MPETLSSTDQQRFQRVKKQIEDLRTKQSAARTHVQQNIETIELLIKRLRDYEEQIQTNSKGAITEYESLIGDCQVSSLFVALDLDSLLLLLLPSADHH